MSKSQNLLELLKQSKIENSVTNLWIVKRSLNPKTRSAIYNLLRVRIDEELEDKLRQIMSLCVRSKKRLVPYDFESSNDDDEVSEVNANETDFAKIVLHIKGSSDNYVESKEDLHDVWGYVIDLLTEDDRRVYGFKKIEGNWELNKKKGF